ncbi:MAG: tyrosine-type recombinase/integrase [Geobacteraceae bacterium]
MKRTTRQDVLLFDNQEKKQGTILRKPGSRKLYVLFYYYSHRIEKSTGVDDNPSNQKKVREWLNHIIELRDSEKLVFAKAFPGASEKEKAKFAELEGWEYSPDPQDIIFKDYVHYWMKEMIPNFSSQSKRKDFEGIINYWLLPYFGHFPIAKINGTLIKRFILHDLVWREGKQKGERLSRARIRNIIIPFREIWNDACCEYNWNLPNPFITVNRKNLPKTRREKPQVFRFAEWQKLLASFDPHYRRIAELFIMTGLSGSEISGLRKTAVKEDHLLIEESIVRSVCKKDLKNDYRFREIPLTDRIRILIEAASADSEGDYVFTMKNGRPFNTDKFRKVWMDACYNAGVVYRKPYTTRHTFAAWSLCLRMDPNRLVALMGHGSKQMIYEVYGQYVKGLEDDQLLILNYFGRDYIYSKNATTPAPQSLGERFSESQGSLATNHLILQAF